MERGESEHAFRPRRNKKRLMSDHIYCDATEKK